MVETLFDKKDVIGVFRGFKEGGMEFRADLVVPYSSGLNNIPMHGRFLLIQLEHEEEAILGRITAVSSDGRLAHGAGEEYNLRYAKNEKTIPENIKEDHLRYKIEVRILGGLRLIDEKIVFVPSFRRIPHVGSPVSFPSGDVLKELANSNGTGTVIGLLAMGEYIYAGDKAKEYGQTEDWMQIVQPEVPVRFDIENLVSRRSFIFARAGFGKSNLNKLLFSNLYKSTPTVKKRDGKRVPVGTVIFDRDGEYFWPDDKGRPGLCDAKELINNIVVFTSRKAPSEYYGSFVAGQIKLDLRRLSPSMVVSLSLPLDKQDQQNVKKLKGVNMDSWGRLVDLVHANGNGAEIETIKHLLNMTESSDVEAIAARSNMTTIVKSLHDPASRLVDMLARALKDGKLCIVDVSQLSGDRAMILSGILLRYIFDRNQSQFTEATPDTIPTIVVIEEAQSVLGAGNTTTTDPFVSWVKEGRKYDLGALMITQQPGSISTEILSQGDNWFVFHLLSEKDLLDVKRANAHFSNDILTSLLNEPIIGQGIFWSSVKGESEGVKTYPIPLRILSFETKNERIDKNYDKPAVNTYAFTLRKRFEEETLAVVKANVETGLDNAFIEEPNISGEEEYKNGEVTEEIDFNKGVIRKVSNDLRQDVQLNVELIGKGVPWGRFGEEIEKKLPDNIDQKKDYAFRVERTVLVEMFGEEEKGWKTYKYTSKAGKDITFIRVLQKKENE